MNSDLQIAQAKALAIKLKLQLLNLKKEDDWGFLYAMLNDIKQQFKHNKLTVEKKALQYGIDNKNKVKELTELAIVLVARSIISAKKLFDVYPLLVELYQSQVNLSMRTSRSMLLQQYSTPAPISYLASLFVQNGKLNSKYIEPSAGNGLMTIAIPYSQLHVNEIDDIRLRNLEYQEFAKVTSFDASIFRPELEKQYDGVVTNPPFAKCEKVIIDGYEFFDLDQVMSVYALKYMKDSGKAAIIVGGHTVFDKNNRVQSGKNRTFLHYLYSRYNVIDIISIDGHKLYSRQGTAFNTRMILIAGRKKTPEGNPGMKTEKLAKIVDSFDELRERFKEVNDIAIESKFVNVIDELKPDGFFYKGFIWVFSDKYDVYVKIGSSSPYRFNDVIAWADMEKLAETKKAKPFFMDSISGFATNEFGNIYTQFKNQPKKAIKYLMKVKEGEAINALYREDIGYIDIIWGENDPKTNKGYGLKHIVEKHGEDIKALGFNIEEFVPIVIQYGNINLKKSDKNKSVFENDMFRFVIARDFKGQSKNWLLTAFDLTKKPD